MRQFFIIFSVVILTNFAFSQSMTIKFEKTRIVNPSVYDFGQVQTISYVKYIVENHRANNLIIKQIEVPDGFYANISEKVIKPNKKVELFIGVQPTEIDTGFFEHEIYIKTNLIQPAIIKIKGEIVK